jgi:hypothetical protein
MSEPWRDINDPGTFRKPEPEATEKKQTAVTDNDVKPKEKPGPVASLSDAKFVPPESGVNFNEKCQVQVSVQYKEQTSQTRITFKLFCDYNDKKDIDLKCKSDANESEGVAKAQLQLFYPDNYTDGPIEYYFTAEHCRGDKAIQSDTIKLPVGILLKIKNSSKTLPDDIFSICDSSGKTLEEKPLKDAKKTGSDQYQLQFSKVPPSTKDITIKIQDKDKRDVGIDKEKVSLEK